MFSGLKDILEMIGYHYASGEEIILKFLVGTFKGKERKYSFVFEPSIRDQVLKVWMIAVGEKGGPLCMYGLHSGFLYLLKPQVMLHSRAFALTELTCAFFW